MTQRAPRKVKSVRMFGLFNDDGLTVVHGLASQCRDEMTDWASDTKVGWKEARKQGFSVRPVQVTYPIRPVKEKRKP